MIASPFICIGDKTTCGGVVMQASPFDFVETRGIAYVTCKIACKRKCVIVGGDPTTIIRGMAAAHFQASQSSSGCRFEPAQRTSGVSSGQSAGATPSPAASAADFVIPIIPETKELLEELDFVELRLVNQDQQPLAGEAYSLTVPDGRVIKGNLDNGGQARIDDVPRGKCTVEFERLGITYAV